MNNIHNQSIPEEILTEATAKINETLALLKPYFQPLTAAERSDILKMSDKSISFVSKTAEFAKNKPELGPSYFNLNELNIDLSDAQDLQGISNTIQQLHSGVNDTMMVAGSEAFYGALIYYNGAKDAAKNNIQGAKDVYEELKKRFPGRSKKTQENEVK